MEILVVVTQCLLLPTGAHHSYTIHTVSLRRGEGGDPSRSYAVSAPADRDASRLYYSYRIIKWGEGGRGGEILVVVTQCLLLPTGTHHSYTTHTVSLSGGRGGGGGGDPSRSYAVSAPADRDASQLYYSYRIIKGGGDPSRSYAVSAPADRDASRLYYSYRIIH